jgi:Flp pilus assembly protein TadG
MMGAGQPRSGVGFWRRRRGAAAVEFAVIAPILCLLLAGAVDFGGAIYTTLKLEAAVSAGANYAQVNALNVGSADGAALAANIANIVMASDGASYADDVVVVNNGPSATVINGGASSGGAPARADACYCPTGSGAGAIVWGAAIACGAACPSGGVAGKFVTIGASRRYSPIFSSYGLVQNRTIGASAVVETQ